MAPTGRRSVPGFRALLLIEETGVSQVVFEVKEVKTQGLRTLLMEPAVDLHDAGIGAIDLTLKDRAVFKRVPKGRLASCNGDEDRDILEVGTHTRLYFTVVLTCLCRKSGLYHCRIFFNEPVR